MQTSLLAAPAYKAHLLTRTLRPALRMQFSDPVALVAHVEREHGGSGTRESCVLS